MQRVRLSSNLHFGLALGIATASVVLALSGCASMGSGPGGSVTTTGAKTAAPAASLDDFSEDEQVRILAVQELVAKAAAEHTLDPALLNAMIWVESRFDPKAKSPSGARGLMQLMPATAAYLAKRMGENNARAYDPEFNVRAGALYLAEMREKFGDEELAVAAYHAGPGNVKKWVESGQKFPDYSEAYVAKVMAARGRFDGVTTHGRRSSDRPVAPAPVSSAKHEPSASEELEAEAEAEAEAALIVPDVASLPDAAEIHGVQRVIYSNPEPEIDETPVFETHPELDREPSKPPPGWRTKPAPSKGRTKPAAKPAEPAPKADPTPEPEPEPEQDELGLGVLPDL